MRVNIITESADWILKRAAQELLPLGWSIGGAPNEADIDYYIPYLLCKVPKRKTLQVGLFTHLEESQYLDAQKKRVKFFALEKGMDFCVALSTQTAKLLNRKKTKIISPGSQFKKQITFGVCGKVHPSGRKNESFVSRLITSGFSIKAWGHGWPCEIVSNKLEDLEAFYRSIDYLIVTSSVEGGPLPVLEALSLGVPVIAPNVGWCWDYPVIKYERDNFLSLLGILHSLCAIPTWDSWRLEHLKLFEALWKKSQ